MKGLNMPKYQPAKSASVSVTIVEYKRNGVVFATKKVYSGKE
jgi:hypothetical protein